MVLASISCLAIGGFIVWGMFQAVYESNPIYINNYEHIYLEYGIMECYESSFKAVNGSLWYETCPGQREVFSMAQRQAIPMLQITHHF